MNVLHESSWKTEYRRSLAKSLFTVTINNLTTKSLLFGQSCFVHAFILEHLSLSIKQQGSFSLH